MINNAFRRRVKNPKKTIFAQLPTEAQTQNKPLFLVLQTEYFNEILAGTKRKEFRDHTEFYLSRLLTKDRQKFKRYDHVIFQNGYHTNARKMTVEIEKITLKTRFVIHLKRIIYKNF